MKLGQVLSKVPGRCNTGSFQLLFEKQVSHPEIYSLDRYRIIKFGKDP